MLVDHSDGGGGGGILFLRALPDDAPSYIGGVVWLVMHVDLPAL